MVVLVGVVSVFGVGCVAGVVAEVTVVAVVGLVTVHRCSGIFLPGRGGGGGVNHLPKKFLQVSQIFTKESKRKEGHTMQQQTSYWHLKEARYSSPGSIPGKFEDKLRRHKQTFGKIATTVTTVVLDKDENLS